MNEQDIYIEAMNLEGAAERLSFLDQACGENSVLRARLEKLIQHSVRVGSFLELPPEPLRVMDEAAIGAEVVGTQIGPYQAYVSRLAKGDSAWCSWRSKSGRSAAEWR